MSKYDIHQAVLDMKAKFGTVPAMIKALGMDSRKYASDTVHRHSPDPPSRCGGAYDDEEQDMCERERQSVYGEDRHRRRRRADDDDLHEMREHEPHQNLAASDDYDDFRDHCRRCGLDEAAIEAAIDYHRRHGSLDHHKPNGLDRHHHDANDRLPRHHADDRHHHQADDRFPMRHHGSPTVGMDAAQKRRLHVMFPGLEKIEPELNTSPHRYRQAMDDWRRGRDGRRSMGLDRATSQADRERLHAMYPGLARIEQA